MASDTYKTIKSSARGLYKDRGSRFISLAYPVTGQDEIKGILDTIRRDYHDARHHCYAYMLGHDRLTWRINDDGEPSGTAGKPILGQINSAGLTNILVVVIRYFGGTLLGTSGLINAYRTATADALNNSQIIEKSLHAYYELKFPYSSMNDIMKIIKDEDAGQSAQDFGLECCLVIDVRASGSDAVINRLSRVDGLNYRYLETK